MVANREDVDRGVTLDDFVRLRGPAARHGNANHAMLTLAGQRLGFQG